MTYCVAWQSKGSVFLLADAAKTSSATPTSDYSTFGELHESERGMTVEEAALKIFRWPKLAMTCAGDVNPIYQLVWEIDRLLARGFLPWIALIVARTKIELKPHETLQAVAATRVFGGARLFHLTRRGEWQFVANDGAVHLGSAAASVGNFVDKAIREARWACTTPSAQLACVLATCQSLTVHQRLMAYGAGGAFSGIIIDAAGPTWQPDIAYLVVNPDSMAPRADVDLPPTTQGLHVSCVVRDDVLFVSSPTKKGAIAFLATTQPGVPAGTRTRVQQAFDKARLARDNCQYDYVSVISTKWPVTAVIQMKGRSQTRHLRLGYKALPNDDRALIIEMEPRVARFLSGAEYPNGPQICFFYDPIDN